MSLILLENKMMIDSVIVQFRGSTNWIVFDDLMDYVFYG